MKQLQEQFQAADVFVLCFIGSKILLAGKLFLLGRKSPIELETTKPQYGRVIPLYYNLVTENKKKQCS